MSRGERVSVTGIISSSMRDNYGAYGVDEYYRRVGQTYRNPHYPGIRQCLFALFNRWWQMEQPIITKAERTLALFDMACGIGEATLAFIEWCKTGKRLFEEQSNPVSDTPARPRRKGQIIPLPLGTDFPTPSVMAADPYTSVAYQDRVSLPCSALSFSDIAEGALPAQVFKLWKEPTDIDLNDEHNSGSLTSGTGSPDEESASSQRIDFIVCSFALHLLETPSGLFSLLWELSLKARWLIILAPHKKPELKNGWGWTKWNIVEWQECSITAHEGELLYDRVHCRIYRSVNV
ncbi:hypothetical protein BDQ17DRAFT_1231671 [Cyathus striatus]|nr:hypothetical protein BDQ17DRAFT_1231671 [Cyathus striatus]